MHPSGRFQEFHEEKNVFLPQPGASSDNPVGGFSRKDNFMMSHQPSHSPPLAMECGFPRVSNNKPNGSCRNNIVNGLASNQLEELSNFSYPNDKNGYWNQNNFVAPWQPNETNLHEIKVNSVYTSSLGQLQPAQWKDPSLAKVWTVPPPSCGHVNQFKAYESSAPIEKSHIDGHFEGFPRYEQSGHPSSNVNASEDNYNPPSKRLLLVENFQRRSLDPRLSSVGLEGQSCFQGSIKVESSYSIQEKSGPYKDLDSSNPTTDGRQLPELYKVHVNDIFVQSQLNSGYSGGLSANNDVKGDAEIEKNLSSAASSLKQPLKEETSAKNEEEMTSSIKADDIASKATEKLWNGTIQLTSTVKLSASAYFKSGDKMPDIYWSDSIEVKGKVRFEAFEKYIQDLPRSRNRGLMVMSLCLREESSKDGLKCVNEVVKKYKDGNRIGFAHLSPGVDVYICPNNETIITILAKNGFFKGMVAVQDYQDSLIGCVVWRKNTTSDPGTRKLVNESLSGHPSNSPPNSNPQQVTESNSSSAKPTEEAIQPAAAKAQAKSGVGGSKNAEPSVHPEVGSCSSSPSPGVSSSFHSSTMDGQAFPPSDLHTIHSIVKQLSEIEASIFQSLGIEKLQGNLELLKNILPPPSEAVKQPVPPPEDDDLPEYDFGAAVPHASTSNPLEANATEKKLNDEGFRPSNELLASSQMCVESQKDAYGGPLTQKRKAHVIDSGFTSLPVVQERAITENSDTMLGSKPKNPFDEDDMPEWLPPDMEHFKPTTYQTTRSQFVSNTFGPPHRGAVNPTSCHVPTSLLPSPPSEGHHYPIKLFPCTSHHPKTLTPQVGTPSAPPLRAPPSQAPAGGYLHDCPRSTTKFSPNPARRPEHRPHNTREPFNRNRWGRC